MNVEEIVEALKPYGDPIKTPQGVLFEMVDEESGVYDRLAFYVPDLKQEAVVTAFIQAIADLTDHDIPGRNVFAFGFKPDFEGTVIEVSFMPHERAGVILGNVPGRVIEIAEKNRIPFERGTGDGIILRGYSKDGVEILAKLIEAITFEW